MKYGFNYGFLGGNGRTTSNACITNCGTDGTYWFYDSNTIGMGESNPVELADETFFYAFKSDSNGKYIIQFGDLGNQKVTDVESILITYGDEGVKIANWDDVGKYYTFTDKNMFLVMQAKFDAADPAGTYGFCFKATILPDPFIVWTYEEMFRVGFEGFTPAPTGGWGFTATQAGTATLRFPVGTTVNMNGIGIAGNDNTNVIIDIIVGDNMLIENDLGCITYFESGQLGSTGHIPDLSANVNLTTFGCFNNLLTGEIPSLNTNTKLVNFFCHGNQLTGSIPSLNNNINLTGFSCSTNQLTGNIPDLSLTTKMIGFYVGVNQLTGNIPNLSTNTSLDKFDCHTNKLTGFDGGDISIITNFYAQDNLLTESAVDAILAGLVSGGTNNATIKLETGNATPSGTGEANIDTLRSNGCTVTVTGNY